MTNLRSFPLLAYVVAHQGLRVHLERVVAELQADFCMLVGGWQDLLRKLISFCERSMSNLHVDVTTFVTMHRHLLKGADTGLLSIAPRDFN